MIIEMVARQVGEGGGRHRQSFRPILRKAMARRFEGCVSNALALQARHVGQKRNDVRRRQARRYLID